MAHERLRATRVGFFLQKRKYPYYPTSTHPEVPGELIWLPSSIILAIPRSPTLPPTHPSHDSFYGLIIVSGVLFSFHPVALPLHTPRRASWLILCSFCCPHTPRHSSYLSTTHPDDPIGSSSVLSALHTTVVHLTSPHTPRHLFYLSTHQDEPLGSSGVLSAVYTPLVACFTSPHTQTSLLAHLVFFLLSTQPLSLALPLHTLLVARFTSPHTQTSPLAHLVFFLLSTNPSSLVLPLQTPRRASWLVWCSFCSPHNCRSPYLSTHPSSLVLPLHAPRRASWLVWCSICYPYTPCHFFYLYTHPDEPLGSSSVLSAVHKSLIARLTSPHTQASPKACLVLFLLSTQPSSLALPLHTPKFRKCLLDTHSGSHVLHISESAIPFHIQDEPSWAWLA